MVQLRIKEIAAKHGLLLKDVCEKAGYKSLPSFYRQINNPENVNMKTLIRIADVIGCDVRDFFSTEIPSPHIVCPKCGEVIPIETVVVPKQDEKPRKPILETGTFENGTFIPKTNGQTSFCGF